MKPQEKDFNDTEVSKDFKIMVTRTSTKLSRRMDEHSEIFNKKKKSSEGEDMVTEMKNTLDGLNKATLE